MSSVRALNSAHGYFQEVLTPNRDSFFNSASTFDNVINLASALFHFHEWLYHEFRDELEQEIGVALPTAGAFWGAVHSKDTRFGYIRDVANASKHVTIGGKHTPSTGMTHIANTHIITTGYGEGGYGEGPYGGGPSVVMEDDGQYISFDDCANALYEFWKDLLAKMPGSGTP